MISMSTVLKGDKLAKILDKKLSEHCAGQCMLAAMQDRMWC